MKFLRAAALAVILAIATQSSANAQSAPATSPRTVERIIRGLPPKRCERVRERET